MDVAQTQNQQPGYDGTRGGDNQQLVMRGPTVNKWVNGASLELSRPALHMIERANGADVVKWYDYLIVLKEVANNTIFSFKKKT